MSGCMKKQGNCIGEDVVVLHQLDRGVFTPNISPFPLKLETYLRMANIPYQVYRLIYIVNNYTNDNKIINNSPLKY